MSAAVVECYAGHRYPERPRSFPWEDERLAVEEIERQQRTPEGLTFHVRTAGGRRFILTYDAGTDTWGVRPADTKQRNVE